MPEDLGAPVPPPPPPPPPAPVASSNRSVMLVLSYLGILALIPLITEKNDREVQWHAQARPRSPRRLPDPDGRALHCEPGHRYRRDAPAPALARLHRRDRPLHHERGEREAVPHPRALGLRRRSSDGVSRKDRRPAFRRAFAYLRSGALGQTRTGTDCSTRPSNVRVYQFRHQGTVVREGDDTDPRRGSKPRSGSGRYYFCAGPAGAGASVAGAGAGAPAAGAGATGTLLAGAGAAGTAGAVLAGG